MINVERINGSELTINSEVIQQIEKTSDTVITFLNGEKIIVKNTPQELIHKIIEFKSNIVNFRFLNKE